MKFSVLISVYDKEKVEFFIEAINSIINQTVVPDQIVLVRDGSVYDELQNQIDWYLRRYPSIFTYVPLKENKGLGYALNIGLQYCRNELVARMDSDDVSISNRFEKQLEFFKNNSDVDIVGSHVSEFCDNPQEILQYRVVPLEHEEIVEFMKKRSPFNHPSIMFKKTSIMMVGSYQSFFLLEDWYLWFRAYLGGLKFANIDESLVKMRILNMDKRRGGKRYFNSIFHFLRIMKKERFINNLEFIWVLFQRFIVHVVLSGKTRRILYQFILRKKTM